MRLTKVYIARTILVTKKINCKPGNHPSKINTQINLTKGNGEALKQVKQPIPPKSRYSKENLDIVHPQWIDCKPSQKIH